MEYGEAALFCPRCGSRSSRVHNCKMLKGGRYIRYRRCPECFFTWRTLEVIIPFEADIPEDSTGNPGFWDKKA